MSITRNVPVKSSHLQRFYWRLQFIALETSKTPCMGEMHAKFRLDSLKGRPRCRQKDIIKVDLKERMGGCGLG
jgi:hypothetical protein